MNDEQRTVERGFRRVYADATSPYNSRFEGRERLRRAHIAAGVDMGVQFSHGDAGWGYIGFGLFRKALARHEGFELDDMAGFAEVRMGQRTGRTGRPWSEVNTPLKPFLDHSDCDGELTPEECRQAAPRLREVIDRLWPEGCGCWVDFRTRQRGLALAQGMEQAAAEDVPLEFI